MKPPERHRIGAEAEKFGVDAVAGTPLPYEGERSVLTVARGASSSVTKAPGARDARAAR